MNLNHFFFLGFSEYARVWEAGEIDIEMHNYANFMAADDIYACFYIPARALLQREMKSVKYSNGDFNAHLCR